MRIAMIDPSLFTLPYDRALVSGIARIGADVVLHGRALRPGDGAAPGLRLAESFYRVAGIPVLDRLPGPLRLGLKGADHAWSMLRLLGRLRRERPDVIHFQWLALPLLDGRLLPRFRRVAPLVLTVHDTNPFNGDPTAGLQSSGFRAALDRFDRLIVHTAQGEARLRAMGIPSARIAVLPHGMLVEPATGGVDRMEGPVSFLLFGKIKPYKGADVLIRAFAAMPATAQVQARLRIVGKPYMDLAPLRALAGSLDVAPGIEQEFVADEAVPLLFGPGTVAVFPYREIEASGVLFLALAHGRPIIASRLGSFSELLADGVHGRLVPPDDVAALAEAMAALVLDRAFAARCAAAVQRDAATVPGWDDIARRTMLLYQAAQEARPAPSRGVRTHAAASA